jgi:hypothetical protein
MTPADSQAAETLERDVSSSITLSRDAKGVYRWEIKAYFDADDTSEPESTLGLLAQIDGQLRAQYLTALDQAAA